MSLYLCPRWRNKIDLFYLFILLGTPRTARCFIGDTENGMMLYLGHWTACCFIGDTVNGMMPDWGHWKRHDAALGTERTASVYRDSELLHKIKTKRTKSNIQGDPFKCKPSKQSHPFYISSCISKNVTYWKVWN